MVTGTHLADVCRTHYDRPAALLLWVMMEIAIIGSDIQEVLGSAIGLQILFGIPLWMGCLLTGEVSTHTFLSRKRGLERGGGARAKGGLALSWGCFMLLGDEGMPNLRVHPIALGWLLSRECFFERIPRRFLSRPLIAAAGDHYLAPALFKVSHFCTHVVIVVVVVTH